MSRNLRACLLCGRMKTPVQFEREGCENCEDILELKGNPSRINKLTTNSTDGLLYVADASRSWVSRYQRITGPGLYCVSLRGMIPKEIREEMPDFYREMNGRLRD